MSKFKRGHYVATLDGRVGIVDADPLPNTPILCKFGQYGQTAIRVPVAELRWPTVDEIRQACNAA